MHEPQHETSEPRRAGRPVTLSVKPATVMLEQEMVDWGKLQAGGLSATIRRLMEVAMQQDLGRMHQDQGHSGSAGTSTIK